MKNRNLSCRKVIRCVLKSGAEFEQFVAKCGRPMFAATLEKTDPDGPFVDLVDDEWLFCDDLDCLMRFLLRWDERGLEMRLCHPSPDEHPKLTYWTVAGLPDYFNEVASDLNGDQLRSAGKGADSEEARFTYFKSLFAKAYRYGFFSIGAADYDTYIADWKADDDKQALRDHCRADKRFGVISDMGTVGLTSDPVEHWVSIGLATGWLLETQLADAGLQCDELVGKTCVINALGEVEMIGQVVIRDRDSI